MQSKSKIYSIEEVNRVLKTEIEEKDKNIIKLNGQISEVFKKIRGTKMGLFKKADKSLQFPEKNVEKITLLVPQD